MESPCGTWKRAPIGRDMPCTNATELLQNAIPAWVAPIIMPSRARALRGSAYAVRRWCPIRVIAPKASESDTGLARLDT